MIEKEAGHKRVSEQTARVGIMYLTLQSISHSGTRHIQYSNLHTKNIKIDFTNEHYIIIPVGLLSCHSDVCFIHF